MAVKDCGHLNLSLNDGLLPSQKNTNVMFHLRLVQDTSREVNPVQAKSVGWRGNHIPTVFIAHLLLQVC